jgi:hypothetical protein
MVIWPCACFNECAELQKFHLFPTRYQRAIGASMTCSIAAGTDAWKAYMRRITSTGTAATISH